MTDPTLTGWVIDLASNVIGKHAGTLEDGAELLEPAYKLLGGQLMLDPRTGQGGVGPMVALPPVSLTSATRVRIYGGALVNCSELDASDRGMLVSLIDSAEQARTAMRAQRSGLVMAGAGAMPRGQVAQ